MGKVEGLRFEARKFPFSISEMSKTIVQLEGFLCE